MSTDAAAPADPPSRAAELCRKAGTAAVDVACRAWDSSTTQQRVMALSSLAWAGFSAGRAWSNQLPANTVLEISLDRLQLIETPTDPMLRRLFPAQVACTELVSTVDAASHDERVKAVLLHCGSCGGAGLAQLHEIRGALTRFHKRTGRPVVCYAPSYGEAASGLLQYWLATACTHIVMAPCGAVNLHGCLSVYPFVAGLLEKLGVDAELTQRSSYKTAANMLCKKGFTEAHREQAQRLLLEAEALIVDGLKERCATHSWRALLADGPYSNERALAAGLVDSVLYYDEVVEELLPGLVAGKGEMPTTQAPSPRVELRSFRSYQAATAPVLPECLRLLRRRARRAVAVVYLEGGVHQGSSATVLDGGASIGSETTCAVLRSVREAAARGEVCGLVLRVDSRGGSYVASDLIHRELRRVEAAGVPVVVSMGNVAASGGFFVGMVGRRVFASPATLTGSIGVVNGKAVVRKGLESVGVSFDEVVGVPAGDDDAEGGGNHAYFSGLHTFNASNRARLEAYTDHIYDAFKGKVAESRGLSADAVEESAQGQVFFAADALRRGLITDIGGFGDALDAMAETLSVAEGRDGLRLRRFPAPLALTTLLFPPPKRNREEANRSMLQAASAALPALAVRSVVAAAVAPFGAGEGGGAAAAAAATALVGTLAGAARAVVEPVSLHAAGVPTFG